MSRRRENIRERSVGSLRDESWEQKTLPKAFCCRSGDEIGKWICGADEVCRQPTWFSDRCGLWLSSLGFNF